MSFPPCKLVFVAFSQLNLKLLRHRKYFRVLFFLHREDVETGGLERIVLAESTPCGMEFQLLCSTANLWFSTFSLHFVLFLGWGVDMWSLVRTFQLKFERTFNSSSRI